MICSDCVDVLKSESSQAYSEDGIIVFHERSNNTLTALFGESSMKLCSQLEGTDKLLYSFCES